MITSLGTPSLTSLSRMLPYLIFFCGAAITYTNSCAISQCLPVGWDGEIAGVLDVDLGCTRHWVGCPSTMPVTEEAFTLCLLINE